MKNVSFDYSNALNFIDESEISAIKDSVISAKESLISGTGEGNDYIGWVNLPENYDKEEFVRIQKAAERIREDSDILLVIGIGGSYLGTRAAIDFINGSMYNELPRGKRNGPRIYYVGNCISTDYTNSIIDIIGDSDFSINVISKSGTTTEPAIAFRIFKELLIKKYGPKEGNKRIYATTDRARGALKNQADHLGYETFVVPDDIGGRYSVLTAVGLLPIAVAGIDIEELMAGAASARNSCIGHDYKENDALMYAATRNILHNKGKVLELLVGYEPSLHYVFEWWKQLYGESEGKDNKGIYPASADFTTDLHSLGQFIQEGSRIMYETVINIKESLGNIPMSLEEGDPDGLNYLQGKDMDFVNKCAMEGTMKAHIEGGVPNLMVKVDKRTPFALGELFYFFEFACGVSGYMLGVNPFNQPGVEAYKKNMFALLGKP